MTKRTTGAWLAAALTLCVIVFGAFVRLSDAGLSCPDWPTCYGRAAWPTQAEQAADHAATAIRAASTRSCGSCASAARTAMNTSGICSIPMTSAMPPPE